MGIMENNVETTTNLGLGRNQAVGFKLCVQAEAYAQF